jgi:PAS domain S-box-containing protein
VESSNDAIIGKDFDGKIISCNEGASQLYGHSPEELIGQPITILTPPELHDEEPKILERVRHDEKIKNYETVRLRKDGTRVDVSLTVSPIKDAHGKIIGASNIARDITERKHAEKKLAEILEDEKIARQSAEAAGQAKDDFLAALSHELRTPLNPVLLIASDAAENHDLPPGVRTDFETIRKNIELEARLIDDLLDLTRITCGKLSLDFRILDAHAVLRDAIAAVQSQINAKRLKLILNLNATAHMIRADAVRLQQVFWNVLKNAVKFTPANGKISIETVADDDKWSLKIIDTGIGMTREELERAFSAFSQGGESHRFGGLGLGLAISRKLVEFHSGQIRALSEGRDRGAIFLIELPLAKAEKTKSPARKKAVANLDGEKTKKTGARILLVEDHEPTRNALTHLLLRRKYKVSVAGSMAEAREIAGKEKIDLVISDIGLPDGSGNDLMAELRERYGLKGIALTGYGMEQDISRSLASGFVAHLTKPIHMQALENVLTIPALTAP